jgi:hypothetical protein
MEQLEDNVKALDVQLTAEQTKTLDDLTTPQLPFPLPFLRMAPLLHAGGTTVNGEPSGPHPFIPKTREDHYLPREHDSQSRSPPEMSASDEPAMMFRQLHSGPRRADPGKIKTQKSWSRN